MAEEIKFAYPGVFPGKIEFSKTIAEVDNIDANGSPYVGTLYPMKLTLDNFVKFYWRMKRITATASMTQVLQIGTTPDTTTSTASLVNGELTLTDTYDGAALTQTTSLETLKSRSCPETFLIKYIIENINSAPGGSNSGQYNNYSMICQGEYAVIAILRSGSSSDLNNYDFYPRIQTFSMECGYDFIYATKAKTSGLTRGTDVTVNVNMDGAKVSEIKLYGFTYPGAISETKSFSDWNIELWPAP